MFYDHDVKHFYHPAAKHQPGVRMQTRVLKRLSPG